MTLIDETTIDVRFSEVDSMGVVWHGNYIKFLEDGRESWGRKYGLHYLEVYKHNVVTPIVHADIDYKMPLMYGDQGIITTEYIDSEAAKLIYKYKITNAKTNQTIATAKTVQVFLDTNKNLLLTLPQFVIDWKKKWKLIK